MTKLTSWQKKIKIARGVFDAKVYAIPYAGDMFEELTTKIVMSALKSQLRQIKEGKICSECGKEKEGKFTSLCLECLETL